MSRLYESKKEIKDFVSVIVPCYNERSLIESKIDNLLFNYPVEKMEILIVDGGSTDGTYELAENVAKIINRLNNQKILNYQNLISVYRSEKGKTKQLNLGISLAHGPIILVSDVDAVMDKGCIEKVLRFFSDDRVGVVGACSVPFKAKFLDPLCWRISNLIRCLQSRYISAPWVIGTCYAFRKSLISRFPDDVVADDAYVALYANFHGKRSVYTDSTTVKEVRNPTSWGQFFYHKHRKANALLREFTRFSYMLPYAGLAWKLLFVVWFLFLIIVAGWSYPFFKQDSILKRVK